MWRTVWEEAYSNIERLDDCNLSDSERASIRRKAEEVKQAMKTKAAFFKVIKSGDAVYLQSILQFQIK